MAVYLRPSVVWSFPAEVGWTHIPRRCSKNSWSWTGWRWIAWSREESGSREINSSGRNPAVRKLRKWSEFSIYWRASIFVSVNPTPNMTFSFFFSFETAERSIFPSPLPQKTRGCCALCHRHQRLFPSNGTSLSFPYPTSLLSSTPTNTRVTRITLGKLNINYFYVIKKVGFLSNSSFVRRFDFGVWLTDLWALIGQNVILRLRDAAFSYGRKTWLNSYVTLRDVTPN